MIDMRALLAAHGVPYVDRETWDARPAKRIVVLTVRDLFMTHHTGPPSVAPTNPTDAANMVRGTQNFHMDTKDWSDIAYNFLIAPAGTVYEGRGAERRGGGSGDPEDGRGWSVCALGNYENDTPTPQMIHAYRALWTIFHDHRTGPATNIGDRDRNTTACPGARLYSHLPWQLLTTPTPGDDDVTEAQAAEMLRLLGNIEANTAQLLAHSDGVQIKGKSRPMRAAWGDMLEALETIVTNTKGKS